MSHILSLISERGAGLFDQALSDRFDEFFGQPIDWRELSEDEAYEIELSDPVDVSEIIVDLPIDWAITPAENRRKKLLLADMDSTMIEEECIDEIANHLGVGDQVSEITKRAMAGELEFESALRERVALLMGLPASELQRVYDERIHLRPGGRTLVQTMRAHGAKAALVSGGFTFFTERVSKALGFEVSRANELMEEGGILNGTVAEPILGPDAKFTALDNYCSEYGLRYIDVLAVGDGANDVTMIKPAGLGVALHAKPILEKEANVALRHTGLTSLLFLQGYSRSEFIDG